MLLGNRVYLYVSTKVTGKRVCKIAEFTLIRDCIHYVRQFSRFLKPTFIMTEIILRIYFTSFEEISAEKFLKYQMEKLVKKILQKLRKFLKKISNFYDNT